MQPEELSVGKNLHFEGHTIQQAGGGFCALAHGGLCLLKGFFSPLFCLSQFVANGEVSTEFVGQLVLEELMVLDPLAAARFASVFRGFASADDYAEFFASVEASPSDSPSQDGESEGDS